MPDGHLGKLNLLRCSLVGLVFALVAQVAAVLLLLHLLPSSASLRRGRTRTDRIGPAAREHACPILFPIFQSETLTSRCLEVLGRDGCGDRRRVCAFRVRRVWAPAGGFEGGRVDVAFVDGEESLAHTVGNLVEVARAELVGDEPGTCQRVG